MRVVARGDYALTFSIHLQQKYVKCNLQGVSQGEDGKEDLDAKLMW